MAAMTVEGGKTWSMFFDGAVNVNGRGIGAVLVSPDDVHHPIAAKLMFDCTHNMAEYDAFQEQNLVRELI